MDFQRKLLSDRLKMKCCLSSGRLPTHAFSCFRLFFHQYFADLLDFSFFFEVFRKKELEHEIKQARHSIDLFFSQTNSLLAFFFYKIRKQ